MTTAAAVDGSKLSGNYSILLVDDEKRLLNRLGSFLREEFEVEVLQAESGEQALELLKEHPVSLLVTDLRMPGMGGNRLIEAVTDSDLVQECIVITGHGDFESAIESMRGGARDFLRKPVRLDDLEQSVRRRLEHVALNERVEQLQNLISGIISTVPVAVLVLIGDRVVYSSPVFQEYFGELPSGSKLQEKMQQLSIGEKLQQRILEGDSFEGEHFHHKLNDGAERLYRVSQMDLQADFLHLENDGGNDRGNNGEHLRLLSFLDHTEQKRANDYQQFSAYQQGISEMSSSILHNVGNVIGGLSGYTHEMSRRGLDISLVLEGIKKVVTELDGVEEQSTQRAVSVMQAGAEAIEDALEKGILPNAERLLEGVEHMAEIIRIQQRAATTGERESFPFVLRHAIDDMVVMQQSELDRLGIDLRLGIDTDIEDPTLPKNQLQQMVLNLIKNSVEAIEEELLHNPQLQGEIVILASVDGGHRLKLQFEDNGIGIEQEKIKKVFRYGHTTKRQGSGVGLHSIATFVQGLGGEISLQSAGPHQGAQFEILLPCMQAEGQSG